MNVLLRSLVWITVTLWAQTGLGQSFPTKPIRWISAWTPGGANDMLSRAIAQDLAMTLGQPVVVENRPGASGTIGTALVAQSPPDGYTVTLGSLPSYSTAPSMYPNLPYDPLRDLAPITLAATVPNVLVVHPSVPVQSVSELIAYARTHPGKLRYSSVGNGSTPHLSAELFKASTGVDMVHVPYKGTAPALTDLLAGRIELAFEGMPALLPHIRADSLRALAVTTKRRSSLLPNLPTIDESGLKGYDVSVWYGVFTSAGTPPDVIKKLNEAINASLRTPEMQSRLTSIGADAAGGSPEALRTFLQQDTQKWAKVIKAANIRFD